MSSLKERGIQRFRRLPACNATSLSIIEREKDSELANENQRRKTCLREVKLSLAGAGGCDAAAVFCGISLSCPRSKRRNSRLRTLLCPLPACLQGWDKLKLPYFGRLRLLTRRDGNAMRKEELDEHYRQYAAASLLCGNFHL